MLAGLTVKNFVLAQAIEVSFAPHLTVMLGETGAGKSVLVAALASVCGLKPAEGKVLDPTQKAYIEAIFKPAPAFLATHPLLADFLAGEDTLILTLTLTAKGVGSRKANGQTMTLTMLKELTRDLVSLHSQNDNDSLFKPAAQLALLDEYGGTAIQQGRTAYKHAYRGWQDKVRALAELVKNRAGADPEFLRYRITEIEDLKLQPDEIEELEQKLAQLAGTVKIEEALMRLKPGVSLLQSVESDLRSNLVALQPTRLASDAEIALSGLTALTDGLARLEQEAGNDDPRQIERLNQRLFSLEPLRRKYGRTSVDILQALAAFKAQLASLENFENCQKDLTGEVAVALEKVKAQAEILTQLRKQVATDLARQVGAEMAALALPEDGFTVLIDKSDEPLLTGQDKVVFAGRLNKGLDYRPLVNVISGGEGSRLMLAVKSVLAQALPAHTVVFDEIDAGISGTIAFKTGLKLHQLAQVCQVICITHLPQVAAFGDELIWVEKKSGADVNETVALNVNPPDLSVKVAELLKGSSDSPAVLATAAELVKQARKAAGEG